MIKRILLFLFIFWLPMILIAKSPHLIPRGKIAYKKVQIKDDRLFSVIDSVISSTNLSNDLNLWSDQYYVIWVLNVDSIIPDLCYAFLENEDYPNVRKDLTKYKSLQVEVLLGFYGGNDRYQYVIPFNNRKYYSPLYFTNVFGKIIGNLIDDYYGDLLISCIDLAVWSFKIDKGIITNITHYYEYDIYEGKEIIYQYSCNIKLWEYTGTD